MSTLPDATYADEADVIDHFTARAAGYDRSSHWCTDRGLMECVIRALELRPSDAVLDLACGTGLVARQVRSRAGSVVGADLTPAMYRLALPYLDGFVASRGEALPFARQFDVVVCRQGIQFMDAAAAAREMVRVLKPGGRVCLINLCAYGDFDREDYFEILRLRNPARRNFFLREDLHRLLAEAGCSRVEVHTYVSREDIEIWSDHGAIPEQNREAIRAVYRRASASFKEIHAVEQSDGGRFVDHMLFGIAVGRV